MTRARVGGASIQEWQETFLASPGATFFHGPAWSLAWEDYSGGAFRPSPRRITLDGDRDVVLGVTVERLRLGRSVHHLSPAGTYGGWVSGHPLGPDDARLLASAIKRLGSVVWRPSPGVAPPPWPTAQSRPDLTHLIDLRGGAESAHAAWSDSARRRVGHAVRAGVVVGEAAAEEDWRDYERVYRASLERWGERASSAYGAGLFAALRARGGSNVRLWVARADGEVVAGALVLTAGRHAAYWHGASEPERAPGAANLLHWEIIAVLAGEGALVYDLNPSGGHEGVVRFKRTLGAVPAEAPLRIRQRPTEALARRIVRRPIARSAGRARGSSPR